MNKTTRNIIIRLSMLIGIGLFIFLVIAGNIYRSGERVKKITIAVDDIEGNYFVEKDQVLEVIQRNFKVEGKNLSGKNLEHIELVVGQIPQVKYANAFVDNQGNLSIKVEQRIPLLRVYNQQGQSFYVDEDGIKFPTTNNYTAKVPVVTGYITEQCDSTKKVNSVALKQLFSTIRLINKNELWNAMIGQYNINNSGQLELIPRLGNCTILLGDTANLEKKLKQLDVFYFDVLRKVGWDYYKVINIMYKNQVVCIK
ncbi:MAG: cell division protein FtsQ/DivIB [Chitinophagales bacterium]|nr:cell division protein FtsQ/DivIB [Chitinophagales bacterium]